MYSHISKNNKNIFFKVVWPRLCGQLQAKERMAPSPNPRQTVPEKGHLKFTCSSHACLHTSTPEPMQTHTHAPKTAAGRQFPFLFLGFALYSQKLPLCMCACGGGLSRPQVTDSSAVMVSTSLVPASLLSGEAGSFDTIPLQTCCVL